MTNNEALEKAKELYELHCRFAEINPAYAERSQELAEYCKVIIDVFEGNKPIGNINDTLTEFRKSLEHNKEIYSFCLNVDAIPKNTQSYKFYCDWYSCCIKALEDYIKGSETV